MDKVLSIIIPYYNTKQYTDILLDILNKQITDEVEVILVDDGSKEEYKTNYKWCNVIRQENGGVSKARNTALDIAVGKYIAFIDSDDEIAENYISTILYKIDKEDFDYCYLSWKTLPGGWNCDVKLNNINDEFPRFNLCCWNRIYRFDLVKDVRFPENKLIAEDADYIRQCEDLCKKKSFISDYMYFYRSDTPDSLTKRFSAGKLNTKRSVIHYNYITSDMTELVEKVKKLNEVGEVIIMTNNNELPELERYAMVTVPMEMCGTEFYGEPTPLFKKITLPIETQIVIYTAVTYCIGGIETFIRNIVMNLYKDYDIIVLYDKMDREQINRIRPFVRVMKNNPNIHIKCDSLIVNRITDKEPDNVDYGQKIQMIHSCKLKPYWNIEHNYNKLVPVSNVVADSFGVEGNVIHNFTYKEKPQKVLRLISCTRLTFEKGAERMKTLAKQLNERGILFNWIIFSDEKLDEEINGVSYMKPTLNVQSYIASSDYLVQLSDSEAYCYSISEALELGVPIISTPLPVLDELRIKDGVHGVIVPFDMKNIDFDAIKNNKYSFKYSNKNSSIKKQWKEILGNTTPKNDYVYVEGERVNIKVLVNYYSMALNRDVYCGEIIETTRERAEKVADCGYCEILE